MKKVRASAFQHALRGSKIVHGGDVVKKTVFFYICFFPTTDLGTVFIALQTRCSLEHHDKEVSYSRATNRPHTEGMFC